MTAPLPADPLGDAGADSPSAAATESTDGPMRAPPQPNNTAPEVERADPRAEPAEPPRLSPEMTRKFAQAKPLGASRQREPPPFLLTTDHEITILPNVKYD